MVVVREHFVIASPCSRFTVVMPPYCYPLLDTGAPRPAEQSASELSESSPGLLLRLR